MLDDGIYTLTYFHKDSVTSCQEIEKNCDKKDCNKENRDNWKKLLQLFVVTTEKIVMKRL